ncbi:MAG: N-acetylmuramoyl-L-alanine amidase family protein [Gemmatimonadales bacterium]
MTRAPLLLCATALLSHRGAVPVPPQAVVIATERGETSVPVTEEREVAAIAAPLLAGPLGLQIALHGARATVGLGGTSFIFELGAPYVRTGGVVYSLVGGPYLARDTLFLPLHWLVVSVPRALGGRYRWDPAAARLEVVAPVAALPVRASPPPGGGGGPASALPTSAPHPVTGLRQPHAIVIDPGHGGPDPGNLGLYLPSGLFEKDVTLAIGRLLRAELTRRGLVATLTRATDTLVDLMDRGPHCTDDCDLFVSIHVNAMPEGRRRTAVTGAETYFLSDAKTEDQKRVAKTENEAIRFEMGTPAALDGDLGFILRDLQQNEYLRESARLADLVQAKVAAIHPGENRGVQQAGFMVLSRARRPAILLEVGFATNRTDAAFIASSLGQRKIVNAVADGIVAYLLEFERKVVFGAGRGVRDRP